MSKVYVLYCLLLIPILVVIIGGFWLLFMNFSKPDAETQSCQPSCANKNSTDDDGCGKKCPKNDNFFKAVVSEKGCECTQGEYPFPHGDDVFQSMDTCKTNCITENGKQYSIFIPEIPATEKTVTLQDVYDYLAKSFPGEVDKNFSKPQISYLPPSDAFISTPGFYGDIVQYNSLVKTPTARYPFSDSPKPQTVPMRIPLKIYNMIISAQRSVDIASMAGFATGAFLEAISSGVAFLDKNRTEPVTVRLLFGAFDPLTCKKLEDFTRTVCKSVSPNTKLRIIIGQYHSRYFITWNHGKIVNIDSENILVGGVNLWDEDYLQTTPIMDCVINIAGNANLATTYTNALWKQLYDDLHCTGLSCLSTIYSDLFINCAYSWKNGAPVSINSLSPAEFDAFLLPVSTDSAQKYAGLGYSRVNVMLLAKIHNPAVALDASEATRLFSFKNAKKRIYISQQALFTFLPSFNSAAIDRIIAILADKYLSLLIEALCIALHNGAEVHIITSSFLKSSQVDKNDPRDSYANSRRNDYVLYKVTQYYAAKKWDAAEISRNFAIRYSSFDGVEHKFQHDKFWMVDNFFYIGSHNMYYTTLSQFGVVCEDPALNDLVLAQHWLPKWQHAVAEEMP